MITSAASRRVAPTVWGMELRDNDCLTFRGPDKEVRRTWLERLFGRPWNPMKATRMEMTFLPDPQFYVLENRVIVAHSETMRALRDSLTELSE